MSFKNELCKLAKTSGSFKTIADRIAIIERFLKQLQAENIQVKAVNHLKAAHIQKYAQSRLGAGIGKRTICNEMAAIRHVLREGGCINLANGDKISNSNLGLDGSSRDGTKQAMPDDVFDAIADKVGKVDAGVEACMHLERELGLRGLEAVRGSQSLKEWEKVLQKSNRIDVIYGTKGGRHRETQVPDRARALAAVTRALTVAKNQGGRLIDKPDLKKAMSRYKYVLASNGAKGVHAPHSMRYSFAQKSLKTYRDIGNSEKDARAKTSINLGHGDGRGRYIVQVYEK